MEKISEIISTITLFNGLDKEEIEAVRHIALNRNYSKGQTIFTEGDTADGFYIVVSGRVKIFKVSPEGKEQIYHIYGPGNPFGEVPVFSGSTFPATAQALVGSNLLFFPRDAFVRLISENPSLSLNMMAVLSRRLRQFTVQIENLSLKEVPGRLASYLIYLSGEEGKNPKETVSLTISKGQLASLLGTIPETLSRIFAKMSEQGLIEVAGRNIRIIDRTGLEILSVHGSLG